MRRLVCGTLLIVCGTAVAQQPLRDGALLELHGTLQMRHAARLQFVTVATTEVSAPALLEKDGALSVEVGLGDYASYPLLYEHRGEAVTVVGRVATDATSPYFWHGSLLRVTSIRTAAGVELKGEPAAPALVPPAIQTYTATASLPKDLGAPWMYGPQVAPNGPLRCASNGGGDVVDCACAPGFTAAAAQYTLGGHREKASLEDTAQFVVSDDKGAVDFAVELSVTCNR